MGAAAPKKRQSLLQKMSALYLKLVEGVSSAFYLWAASFSVGTKWSFGNIFSLELSSRTLLGIPNTNVTHFLNFGEKFCLAPAEGGK
jgi:hypothetical protein